MKIMKEFGTLLLMVIFAPINHVGGWQPEKLYIKPSHPPRRKL